MTNMKGGLEQYCRFDFNRTSIEINQGILTVITLSFRIVFLLRIIIPTTFFEAFVGILYKRHANNLMFIMLRSVKGHGACFQYKTVKPTHSEQLASSKDKLHRQSIIQIPYRTSSSPLSKLKSDNFLKRKLKASNTT
jgi:hypothetical protein